MLSIAAGLTLTGCSSDDSGHSHGEEGDHSHETAETTAATHSHSETEEGHTHSGETEQNGSHSHEGEGAEMMLGLGETYDQVRKGVRLTLSFDNEAGSFTGTVENTTQEALPQVLVGVRLSNGAELGPTTPVDLDAGESQQVKLDAAGESFESWDAHSEMGSGGHSHGEEGDHEHHN